MQETRQKLNGIRTLRENPASWSRIQVNVRGTCQQRRFSGSARRPQSSSDATGNNKRPTAPRQGSGGLDPTYAAVRGNIEQRKERHPLYHRCHHCQIIRSYCQFIRSSTHDPQGPARRNQRPSLVCSEPVLLPGYLIGVGIAAALGLFALLRQNLSAYVSDRRRSSR